MTGAAPADAGPTDPAGAAGGLRRWLTSGAVQRPDGSIAAWVDARTGTLAFAYPEITGYWLTYVTGLPDLRPDERAGARRAADWLAGRIGRGQLAARDGWDGDRAYAFDLAIMANGLAAFARGAGSPAHLHAARRAVDAVVSGWGAAGGPVAVLPGRGPSGRDPAWSTVGVAHLAKTAQALLAATHAGNRAATHTINQATAHLTARAGNQAATHITARAGNRAATRAAAEVVGLAGRHQRGDGRFATGGAPTTLLHPHLYAAEGLWVWACATGSADAARRSRRAVAWSWRVQLPTGGLPRHVDDEGGCGPEQLDATAQAVRLSHLLGLASPAADRAERRLLDRLAPGATGCALPYAAHGPGSRHLNVWASLFAAQALAGTPGPGDWAALA